jgi:prepilin-type N-terminal cleavage/methylation domain-containing protein
MVLSINDVYIIEYFTYIRYAASPAMDVSITNVYTLLMYTDKRGFTIVELLIVIVVIAILAAISIVAYNGIQDRARTSQVAAAASQAAKQVTLTQTDSGTVPGSLASAGVTQQSGVVYDYSVLNDAFCVSTGISGNTSATAGYGTHGSCGLKGEYFNAPSGNFTGTPALVRQDKTIDFDWGGASPGKNVNADQFSVRWTGYLTAPAAGAYVFRSWVDDSARVYINNIEVINRWGTGCCTWVDTNYTFSAANQRLPIRIEMAEGVGGAGTRLHWNYPNTGSFVPIPSAAFSY